MHSFPGLDAYLQDPWGTVRAVLSIADELARAWAPVLAPLIAVGLPGLALTLRWWRKRCEQRLHEDARLVTVLPPPTVEPAGGDALWSNLVGLLRPAWARRLSGQPHLSWEYVFDADGARAQIWVPGVIPPGLVERAVESAWPGALVRVSANEPPTRRADPNTETAGGELRLTRCEALPLRTDFPAEPLRALLGAATGMRAGDQAVVQVLARPVAGGRVRRARRAARRLRSGVAPNPVGRLLDLITPNSGAAPAAPPSDHQTSLAFSAQDRAIIAKTRGPLYETRVRYTLTAHLADPDNRSERQAVRARLRGSAHMLAGTFAVFSEHNYYRRVRLRSPLAATESRRLRRGDLLAVAELARLAHLPADDAAPGMERAGARAVPPPPHIAVPGPDAKAIGITDTNPARPVALRVADARQHTHILGATGAGKSELIARLVLTDAHAGRGVVVVDPKGDLVADLLGRLPEHLAYKVVLFDPDARTQPPILNPLDGSDATSAVENVVSVFSRVHAASWGPRTDDILRAALLTLRAMPQTPTLTDVPTLLTDGAFRQRAVAQLDDHVLRGFWRWYDGQSDASREHVTAPLMNKLRSVLLRPYVRAALAGGPSTVKMDDVLDGGICLVRASVGTLGTDTARLFGSLVVAQVWQAATRRARIPQADRRDASLYLDECQHFLNLPYGVADILAEARGLRLAMTLAHQHLAQLPKELAEAVSANARNKIYFNASPEDAKRLAAHTSPHLASHDLSHLAAFHAVVRLVVDGGESRAFTIRTEALPPAVAGRARRIRTAAVAHARTDSGNPGAPDVRRADPRRAA
jgi:hypothetical protein